LEFRFTGLQSIGEILSSPDCQAFRIRSPPCGPRAPGSRSADGAERCGASDLPPVDAIEATTVANELEPEIESSPEQRDSTRRTPA